jgi:hypothetical protein
VIEMYENGIMKEEYRGLKDRLSRMLELWEEMGLPCEESYTLMAAWARSMGVEYDYKTHVRLTSIAHAEKLINAVREYKDGVKVVSTKVINKSGMKRVSNVMWAYVGSIVFNVAIGFMAFWAGYYYIIGAAGTVVVLTTALMVLHIIGESRR